MVEHLYRRFLMDDREYQRSDEFWAKLCREVVAHSSKADDWAPWSNKTFLNGTPIREGHLTYDLVSFSTSKGIRIFQEEPRTSEVELSAWTDTRGGEPGEEGAWDELVINCALSKESAELARQLLVEWVQFECPRQEFEPTIARILGW